MAGDIIHAVIDRLARVFAQLGGLVLSALILLTCLSVAGRSLNSFLHGDIPQSAFPAVANALLATGIGPVSGDFELVEAGMAFAIFAFLPLCQLKGAHAFVDIFTSTLPPRAHRSLVMVIEFAFTATLALIAWQLFEGMQSKRSSGQTSFLLQFPIWWAYAASLSGAVVATLVSAYVAATRLVEVTTGLRVPPPEAEADR